MRSAAEILDDDLSSPPSPSAPLRVWMAWLDRLDSDEYEAASLEMWLRGVAHASSGLTVPEDILSDPRLGGTGRVVLAALQAPGSEKTISDLTRRIFGHEASEFRSMVVTGLDELAAAGLVALTADGRVIL